MVWSKTRRRLNGADSSSSFPASIFAESKRSLSRANNRSAESLAVFRKSVAAGSTCFGNAKSTMPRMAFMGVRNSWLMFARNRLLASLAASAAALASFVAPSIRLRSVMSTSHPDYEAAAVC